MTELELAVRKGRGRRLKAESAARYRGTTFGNAARQWLTYDEFAADDEGRAACDAFAIRDRRPNGLFRGHIRSAVQVDLELGEICTQHGRPLEDFYFSEMVDDRRCLLNGEVMRGVGGLELHYSTAPVTMRRGLRFYPKHASGLTAKMIVEHLCCARGADAVWELLDEYPDHIVEFAAFSKAVGLLGWRTIIWEVRNY